MALLAALILIYSSPLDEIAHAPSVSSCAAEKQADQPLLLEGGKTIAVSQIIFSGNKAIPTSALEKLTRPYLNRSISQTDLMNIKQRVELLYKSKGYAQVQVSFSAVKQSGTLTVAIKEGKKAT